MNGLNFIREFVIWFMSGGKVASNITDTNIELGLMKFVFITKNITYVFVFILLCLCIFMVIKVVEKNSIMKELFEPLGKSGLKVASSMFIGIFLGQIMDFSITTYMPAIIYMFSISGIIIYGASEWFYSRNNRLSNLAQIFNYIEIIALLECLLMTMMGKLEFKEFLAILALCYLGELSIEIINSLKKEKLEKKIRDELFESRKTQLEVVKMEIDAVNKECPYVIMLTGTWGSGKSTFIESLKDEINENEFINIQLTYDCDIKATLNEMENQLNEILKKNGVISKRSDLVNRYFKAILDLLNISNYRVLISIGKLLTYNNFKYKDSREELEKALRKINHRIFIIFDDLDRCRKESIPNFFGVLHKSMKLANCISVFAVDEKRIKAALPEDDYLEKYYDRRIELCNVSFKEILEKYIYSSNFDKEISEIGLDKKHLVANIERVFEEIYTEYLKDYSTRIHTKRTTKNEIEKGLDERDIKNDLNRTFEQNNLPRINNPRKVYRFLFEGVLRLKKIVYLRWFSNTDHVNNKYSKEDWDKLIIYVAFLKYFCEEDFNKIINYENIDELNLESDNYVLEIIYKNLKMNDQKNTKRLFEMLCKKIYILDSNSDITHEDKLMKQFKEDVTTVNKEELFKFCLFEEEDYTHAITIAEYLKKYYSELSTSREDIIKLYSYTLLNLTPVDNKYSKVYESIEELYEWGIKVGIILREDKIIGKCKKNLEENIFAEFRDNFTIIAKWIWGKDSITKTINGKIIEDKIISIIDNIYNFDTAINSFNKAYSKEEIKYIQSNDVELNIKNFLKAIKYKNEAEHTFVYRKINQLICEIENALYIWQKCCKRKKLIPGKQYEYIYFDFKKGNVNESVIKNVRCFSEAIDELNTEILEIKDNDTERIKLLSICSSKLISKIIPNIENEDFAVSSEMLNICKKLEGIAIILEKKSNYKEHIHDDYLLELYFAIQSLEKKIEKS